MSNLKQLMLAVDEEFLVALANKGLYKRALREFSDAGIVLTWEKETLSAVFADSTSLTVSETIQNYTCSCPSRTHCKHLLMVVLAVQAESRESEDVVEVAPPDFSYLLTVSLKELEKLTTHKVVQNAIVRFQVESPAKIEKSSVLIVTLPESNHVVHFFPSSNITNARCSCKSENPCLHIVQAILSYIQEKQGTLPEGFLLEETKKSLLFDTAVVPYLQEIVAQIFDLGLVRIPEEMAGRFRQIATLCHGRRLANLERVCLRVANQLELYFLKSAIASTSDLVRDLCYMLILCHELEKGRQDKEIVGVFREEYHALPRIELYGLGAYGWISGSGYTGITVSLFNPAENRVYTYSTVLPQEQCTHPSALYQSGAPWNMMLKISTLGRSHFWLQGGKSNERMQLSASLDAVGTLEGSVSLKDSVLDPIRYTDFLQLLDDYWEKSEARALSGNQITVLLEPNKIGEPQFDRIKQIFTLPLYDKDNHMLVLEILYSPANHQLIEAMFEAVKEEELTFPLVANIWISDGKLKGFPIAHNHKNATNLGLDIVKQKKYNKPLFDWGI